MPVPQDREVRKAGYRLIIRSGTVSKLVEQTIRESLPIIALNYLKAVQKNINLTDHDLQELRRLGHPYAVDSPGKRVHADDALVHIQSGELYSSLKMSLVRETLRTFGVYLETDVPYIDDLIYGTSRMRPRPFHRKAYEESRQDLWDPLIEELRRIKHRIEEV